MFVVGRALSLGRRAALVTVAGNAVGFYAQVVLVALGLGAIVERSTAVFTAIKLIGALYLVWVGAQAIIHRRANAQRAVLVEGADVAGHRSLFLDGFVVGVANPKTIVFFAAILPQFVVADGAPAGVQMLALGVIFAVIALGIRQRVGPRGGHRPPVVCRFADAPRTGRCRRGPGNRRSRRPPGAHAPLRLTAPAAGLR